MKVVNYSKIIHKERTDKTMAELSHLDQLEAEAIYIIREVAAFHAAGSSRSMARNLPVKLQLPCI